MRAGTKEKDTNMSGERSNPGAKTTQTPGIAKTMLVMVIETETKKG